MTPTIHTAKPPGCQSEQNPRINLLDPFGPQLEQFTEYQLLWLISKGQRKPRFSALSQEIWTVNHHALLCAYIYPQALWHDAAEAFLGDWPTPVKSLVFVGRGVSDVRRFSDLEKFAQAAIESALGLKDLDEVKIKEVDNLALRVEDAALGMGIFQESVISPQNMMLFNRVNELSTEEAAQKWLDLAMEVLGI